MQIGMSQWGGWLHAVVGKEIRRLWGLGDPKINRRQWLDCEKEDDPSWKLGQMKQRTQRNERV